MLIALLLLAAAPASTAPSEAMICRREMLTGTRFARKICMTRAQRDAMANKNDRELSEMRMRQTGGDAMAYDGRRGDGTPASFCIAGRGC